MAKQPVTATPNGKNVELKLTNVPLSFVEVWEPTEGTTEQGQPNGQFGVSTMLLFDKTVEWSKTQIEAIKDAMKTARDAEWSDGKVAIAGNCLCLQDGEPIDPMTNERKARWDGLENKLYISAKKPIKAKTKAEAAQILATKHPVQILGPRKTDRDSHGNPCFPTLTEKDDLIYSGAICDVIIQIYPYNGTGKKPGGSNHPNRINASLECIKFVEHGTRLGGGKKVDAQNAFDEEDDDDAGSSVASETAAPTDDAFDALG